MNNSINNMNLDEAIDYLSFANTADEGPYWLMRLGKEPSVSENEKLLEAMKIIWKSTSDNDSIAREVAFHCGTMLNFSNSCHDALVQSNASKATIYYMEKLTIAAYDILAGENALQWQTPFAAE
ncbi:hypothetical protein [Rubinisphaera italica]|uniref:Uncharacterized protein n=1 Tax=Rubinisphaera italica TaxID=2527969 RepID=A0A5C5XCT9_9PLAN|nr:hypothetical protein [Rubinisphaera italica]TWT59732.1 hypothetical protein Pan54_04420 [Rubinisphaera italica]